MSKQNELSSSMSAGELSPDMYARSDLPIYAKSLSICENFILKSTGVAAFRGGTRFVHNTRFNLPAVLVPFQYSDEQAYMLELSGNAAGVTAMRIFKDGSIVTQQPKNITAITNANPGVITIASHGYVLGNEVFIKNVGGMIELNSGSYYVNNVTTNTFSLSHVGGTAVNTTSFGTYTSGGTAARVYEIASPYVLDTLFDMRYMQYESTMYMLSGSYLPRKITRTGHANWTLATYSRTADPFTGADGGDNCPKAGAFTPDGRCTLASTKVAPTTFWGSRAPTSSGSRHDDFTTGANPTDAIIFTGASVLGKVDNFQAIANAAKSVILFGMSSIRRMYGATPDAPVSPTSINIILESDEGCSNVQPVSIGSSIFFVDKSRRSLQSISYDFNAGGYVTDNRHVVAGHISKSGILTIAQQKGKPNIIWTVNNDGRLSGMTFTREISAWHKHLLGGRHINVDGITVPNGKVISAAALSKPNDVEELWLIVERTINGTVTRTIEYMTAPAEYPHRDDYFSGADNEAVDTEDFLNATYEAQKDDCFLDCSLSFDGSTLGEETLQTGVNIAATSRNITGITKANPGVVTTSAAHTFVTGDLIYVSGVGGMTTVNNNYFYCTVLTSTTFQLTGVDTTAFATYTSGGTAVREGVTKSQPPWVHTSSAHGIPVGSRVFISGVGGTTQVNNQYYIVGANNTTSLVLYRDGAPIIPANYEDGTSWSTYTSGGTVQLAGGIAIDPGATATTVGASVTFTANFPIFTSAMINREIRKPYDIMGGGGGVGRITAVGSSTSCTVFILEAFDNADAMAAGKWYLTASTLYAAQHLIGEEIDVVGDGNYLGQITVASNASIALGAEYSKVHVGYAYRGRLGGMNLDVGGDSGPAGAKPRSVNELELHLRNTLDLKVGTSFYDVQPIEFTSTTDIVGRPTPPFNGIKTLLLKRDKWGRDYKRWTVIHDMPTPCTVLAVGPHVKTTDEQERPGFMRR